MKLKTLVTASLVSLLLAGGSLSAAENSDYTAMVKSAKQAIDKAASIGGEWRDSRKFLKKADEAAKAGDYAKAMKLAQKAKGQGEMGYRQAVSQQSASEAGYLSR